MTLKNAFIRYLKNKGLYGFLINKTQANMPSFFRNNLIENIYYFLIWSLRDIGIADCWYYSSHTIPFNRFLKKEFNCNVKMPNYGDVITAVTLDGKYKFNYKVVGLDMKRQLVTLEGGNSIKLNRVSKLNEKKIDYVNCWKLNDTRVYDVIGNYLK